MKRLVDLLFPSPSGRGGAERTRAQREPEGAGEGSVQADHPGQTRTLTPAHLPKGEGKSRLRRIRHAFFVAAVALVIALGSTSAFAIDPLPFQNAAQRERFQHLTRELRCMVCQDESLLASNADFAKQLRHKIFGMMQEGKSDAEIKQYLVARYSNFILYDPPLATSTIALWFGTPAVLLVGAGIVIVLLRRRTLPAATIPEEPGEDW